ncbi:MAG: Trm112 family protein [Bifidobacteriaceae bacterium]|jgi:uncharacterized protein YbaR (Trm112 family)|nr:Trm112 family protein [Bifidobacteriaceae bacterium]
MMEHWVREALRCPACRGQLTDRPGHLVCPPCRLAYPIREGIPVMLAGRAVALEDLP